MDTPRSQSHESLLAMNSSNHGSSRKKVILKRRFVKNAVTKKESELETTDDAHVEFQIDYAVTVALKETKETEINNRNEPTVKTQKITPLGLRSQIKAARKRLTQSPPRPETNKTEQGRVTPPLAQSTLQKSIPSPVSCPVSQPYHPKRSLTPTPRSREFTPPAARRSLTPTPMSESSAMKVNHTLPAVVNSMARSNSRSRFIKNRVNRRLGQSETALQQTAMSDLANHVTTTGDNLPSYNKSKPLLPLVLDVADKSANDIAAILHFPTVSTIESPSQPLCMPSPINTQKTHSKSTSAIKMKRFARKVGASANIKDSLARKQRVFKSNAQFLDDLSDVEKSPFDAAPLEQQTHERDTRTDFCTIVNQPESLLSHPKIVDPSSLIALPGPANIIPYVENITSYSAFADRRENQPIDDSFKRNGTDSEGVGVTIQLENSVDSFELNFGDIDAISCDVRVAECLPNDGELLYTQAHDGVIAAPLSTLRITSTTTDTIQQTTKNCNAVDVDSSNCISSRNDSAQPEEEGYASFSDFADINVKALDEVFIKKSVKHISSSAMHDDGRLLSAGSDSALVSPTEQSMVAAYNFNEIHTSASNNSETIEAQTDSISCNKASGLEVSNSTLDAGESYLPSVEEDKEDNLAVLDFRSILDHPIETSTTSLKIDPSWDANRVYFNEFHSPVREQIPGFNIFDTRDWADNEVSGRSYIEAEEKKEKELHVDQAETSRPFAIANEMDLDPTGWPRLHEGFSKRTPLDPFALEDDLAKKSYDDADNLLGGADRSESGITDILGNYAENIAQPSPKEQRLAEYTKSDPDETSLEAQSDDECESESSNSDDNVAYEMQSDEQDASKSDDVDDAFAHSSQVFQNLPIFDVPTPAFFDTNNGAHTSLRVPLQPQPPTTSLIATKVNAAQAPMNERNAGEIGKTLVSYILPNGSSENFVASPSSSPAGSKEKEISCVKSVPLLAPPPEDKLKKWLSSKVRAPSTSSIGVDTLVADFPSCDIINQSIHSAQNGAITSACTSDLTTLCDSKPDVMNVGSEKTHQSATFKDSPPLLPLVPPLVKDKKLGPTSSSAIIHDTNFAEKVGNAISAAASKCEEHVNVHSAYNESIPLGAFSPFRKVFNAGSTEDDADETDGTMLENSNDGDKKNRESQPNIHDTDTPLPVKTAETAKPKGRNCIFPEDRPSPFELAVASDPHILTHVLSFIGDPVAVCRVKMTCKACCSFVDKNEHHLMRDAVRLGGMSMNVRPCFWLWVTLQKNQDDGSICPGPNDSFESDEEARGACNDLIYFERMGRQGKWHSVIDRDVARSFGTLPPHKSGARLRTDSIVRALVTWGKNRIMKRGVKGMRDPPFDTKESQMEQSCDSVPTDTVSDWGGVTPVGSFASSVTGAEDSVHNRRRKSIRRTANQEELALGGNMLTDEMKVALQGKLSFILHALSAAHDDVGYCQGEDYIVAHLLRILQDTIRWKAANGNLPSVIQSAPRPYYCGPNVDADMLQEIYKEIDKTLVVEESCFRVMNTLFTNYNLRHFYWPELRCLKTCCLVFERLIQIKLPVLADHFEHHELNVGLFALGWFQTLFLYLPSMPSATVCHMWDIWLVERSFKIFFRVGTAILFLSQPILLNHDLEGMMCYLNTFPDATLLSPDILIASALQIKVTNLMLMAIEADVTTAFE
jgi:hypothetical protein